MVRQKCSGIRRSYLAIKPSQPSDAVITDSISALPSRAANQFAEHINCQTCNCYLLFNNKGYQRGNDTSQNTLFPLQGM